MAKEIKIIQPQEGFQEKFVRSNVDVVFGGGNLGGGKTFASVLAIAEAVKDPNFRAIYVRKNLNDLKTAGGIAETFRECYGDLVSIKLSEMPRFTFPMGSWAEGRHLADENPQKLREAWRGVQTDAIFFDELTGFEWSTFTYLMTRVRGTASWTNKIRATLNPKRSHWTRKFLDWYIGADGFINPERDGVVRYFYVQGDNVDSVVWGDTKKEVYSKCRADIDKKLQRLGGDFNYEELIKSFVFYEGKLSANKIMLKNNTGYIGNVVSSGGKVAQQILEGNFDVDDTYYENIPVDMQNANEVFNNDPQINNDLWITCDLADVGTDNTVALVWNGFHIIDMVVKGNSTPKMNAQLLIELAKKWDIGHSHIIYDRNNAVYIRDYIPEAVGFVSYYKSMGIDMFNLQSLKDECYWRLVYMINNNLLSFSRDVYERIYYHKKIKIPITVKTEFLDECSAIRFKMLPGGKKKLWSKEAMNALLGKDRSMDLLDPCAMRMYPILGYNKGEELASTSINKVEEEEYNNSGSFFGDNDFSGFYMNEN